MIGAPSIYAPFLFLTVTQRQQKVVLHGLMMWYDITFRMTIQFIFTTMKVRRMLTYDEGDTYVFHFMICWHFYQFVWYLHDRMFLWSLHNLNVNGHDLVIISHNQNNAWECGCIRKDGKYLLPFYSRFLLSLYFHMHRLYYSQWNGNTCKICRDFPTLLFNKNGLFF